MGAIVQSANSSGGTTSASATLNGVTSGNAIVCTVYYGAATGSITGVSDPTNGAYTFATNTLVQAQTKTMAVYYLLNVSGGSITVTSNFSTTESSPSLVIYEVSGLSSFNAGNTGNSASTLAPATGNVAIGSGSFWLFGYCRGPTITGGESGWTGTNPQSINISGAAGNYASTWTCSPAAAFAGIVVSFVNAGPAAPTVTALSPVGLLSNTSAALLGLITNGGTQPITSMGFNWGLTTGYGNTVPATGIGGTNQQISALLSGLSANTTYHFQVFATNSVGTGTSSDSSFTTSSVALVEILLNTTQLGTSGSDTGSTTKANLLDANNFTIWSTSVSNTWAGVDAGIATTLTRVRLSPVPVFEDGAIGNLIQGSNDPTFATGVQTLYTFVNRLITTTLQNEILISDQGGPYRYYRVLSPSTWYIADLDFLGANTAGVTGQCVDPVISPAYANQDTPVSVSISTPTTGAAIWYTTDGSTPSSGGGTSILYSGPFLITSNKQVNAIAVLASFTNSRIITSTFIVPSGLYSHQAFYDNRNAQVAAVQGCVFKDPISGYWYKYLINQDTPGGLSVSTPNLWQGYNVYRSTDLMNWQFRGNICQAPAGMALGYSFLGLRLQMLYNATTGLYVCFLGPDTQNTYGLTFWTSSSPEGPFTKVATYTGAMADGFATTGQYGDVSSFVDVDGKAYIIYNCNANTQTCISQLNPANYTNTLGPGVNSASYNNAGASIGEGFAMCKRGSTYFFMYSQLTGGSYNLNRYVTGTLPIGPWSAAVNPFQSVSGFPNLPAWSGGGAPNYLLAYASQTDQILNIPGRDDGSGMGAYFYIGDDNQPSQSTHKFGVQVMLPIKFPTATSMTITLLNSAWFDGTSSSEFNLNTVAPLVSQGGGASPWFLWLLGQ